MARRRSEEWDWRRAEYELKKRMYEDQRRRQARLDREQRDNRQAAELEWRRLLSRASLVEKVGRWGAGWTVAHSAAYQRRAVDLGYWKPWQGYYSETVKIGK